MLDKNYVDRCKYKIQSVSPLDYHFSLSIQCIHVTLLLVNECGIAFKLHNQLDVRTLCQRRVTNVESSTQS